VFAKKGEAKSQSSGGGRGDFLESRAGVGKRKKNIIPGTGEFERRNQEKSEKEKRLSSLENRQPKENQCEPVPSAKWFRRGLWKGKEKGRGREKKKKGRKPE